MTALSYHAYRLQTDLHAEFDGNRQRIAAAELAVATVERTADGIAVIAPSDLMATFRTQPADAWAMLATLTPAQLTVQAIDTACYLLDVEGRDISWSSVLETWTTRLAVIAEAVAEAEQLAESYAPYTVCRRAVTRYRTAQAEPFPGDEPIIGTPEPVPSFSNATLAYAVQVTTSTSVTRYRLDNSYEEAVLFMGAVSGVCPDRPDPVLMRRLCVLWSELFSTPEPTADTADDARIAAVTAYTTAQAEPFPGDDEPVTPAPVCEGCGGVYSGLTSLCDDCVIENLLDDEPEPTPEPTADTFDSDALIADAHNPDGSPRWALPTVYAVADILDALVDAVDAARQAAAGNSRWLNAINAGFDHLLQAEVIEVGDHNALIYRSESGQTYHANGTCQCAAFASGNPCKHRAAARLVQNAVTK